MTLDGDDATASERNAVELDREAHLVDVAARAYQVARREVFDLGEEASLQITARQRQVLAALVMAEEELRQFRVERSERLADPKA